MKCNEIREMMPDMASGLMEVTPEVSGHLAGCGACAAKLEEFKQTMALLDEWQSPEPSPYFDVRLQIRQTCRQLQRGDGQLEENTPHLYNGSCGD